MLCMLYALCSSVLGVQKWTFVINYEESSESFKRKRSLNAFQMPFKDTLTRSHRYKEPIAMLYQLTTSNLVSLSEAFQF